MKARRWAVWMLAAAVFVALRLKFNREYDGAPWEALVAGTAKLPFGHRVLVPWLVRPFVDAGLSIRSAFGITEWLATLGVLSGVHAALRRFVSDREASVGALAFVGVLGLAFLLRFRWPIFYPWDTPAIACMAWGVALASARKHGPLVVLAVVGAANRESAILLPCLTLAMLWFTEHRAEAVRSASLQSVGVVLVRLAVGILHPVGKGGAVDLRVAGMWRIDHNLQWLSDPMHALVILGAFSGLPMLWVLLRGSMPRSLRRLELVIVPVFAGLLVVANIYEPRAFGEPLTLLYLGVAVGALRWMQQRDPEPPVGVLERWGALAMLTAVVIALGVWSLLPTA